MRTAVLIVGLLTTVLMLLWGFLASLTGSVASRGSPDFEGAVIGLSGGGWLFPLALLYLVGALLARPKPRASLVVYILAGFAAFALSGRSTFLYGYPLWGLLAFILAALCYFGRPQRVTA